jgi:translation initiation factor 1
MPIKNNASLVYSSSTGRICPGCTQPIASCACRASASLAAPGDGVVRVGRQTKVRKGKGVTVISGVPLPPDELKMFARELKQKCGSGGTLKDGVIEIQGDHRDSLLEFLKARGWTAKRSGG